MVKGFFFCCFPVVKYREWGPIKSLGECQVCFFSTCSFPSSNRHQISGEKGASWACYEYSAVGNETLAHVCYTSCSELLKRNVRCARKWFVLCKTYFFLWEWKSAEVFPYLLTYLLTPWCRILLEKLTGLQLAKKFPAFHGTRRFITALTSVRQLSLSWASPIQSIHFVTL